MKEKFLNLLNKSKNILSNKKIIIGVITFTLVMSIILIISISISNKGTVKTLRSSSWEDFEIYIEGHTINLGMKLKELDKMDFILKEPEYLQNELPKNYTTSGILYTYKEEKEVYNELFFSANNDSNKEKKFLETKLSGIEINQNFYNNYQVILPKGIVLNTTLKIDMIIKKWSKPTFKENNEYQWKNENGLIKFYVNKDNTVFSVIYTKH